MKWLKFSTSRLKRIKNDELNEFGAGQLDAAAAVKLAQKGQWPFWQFFRWLWQTAFFRLRLWFDLEAVPVVPKLLMIGVPIRLCHPLSNPIYPIDGLVYYMVG